jgi:hypothetical protein
MVSCHQRQNLVKINDKGETPQASIDGGLIIIWQGDVNEDAQ